MSFSSSLFPSKYPTQCWSSTETWSKFSCRNSISLFRKELKLSLDFAIDFMDNRPVHEHSLFTIYIGNVGRLRQVTAGRFCRAFDFQRSPLISNTVCPSREVARDIASPISAKSHHRGSPGTSHLKLETKATRRDRANLGLTEKTQQWLQYHLRLSASWLLLLVSNQYKPRLTIMRCDNSLLFR